MFHLLLLALLATAPDPAGWSKAKWSMTEDQVIAAFPGQAVRLDRPSPNCPKQLPATVAIPGVQIGATTYGACFSFEQGQLQSVFLKPANRVDESQSEFDALELLLAQKYGRPFHRSGDNQVSVWTVGTTRITLELNTIRAIGTRFLHLTYERANRVDANI